MARTVAERLRIDAAARDQAGKPPHAEIELLRESGLLALDPADHRSTHQAARIVASADASIGHLLGYHYVHLWRAGLYDNTDLSRNLREEAATGRVLVAAVSNPRDTIIWRDSVVVGRGAFATGCAVADRLLVSAIRDDRTARVVTVVRGGTTGLEHPADWDNLGQRLSASGSIRFDAVPGETLGTFPVGEPGPLRLTLVALAFQAVLTQVLVGLAEGALGEAARYTRDQTRPWPASGLDRAADDPHILAAYGELEAEVRAARLLADDATRVFAEADARGDLLTDADRGRAGLAISAAKVVATRTALDVTSRIFELTGARSTSRATGLDRFWRDARTLTVHDPVVYKARELGAFLLSGEFPAPTAYS